MRRYKPCALRKQQEDDRERTATVHKVVTVASFIASSTRLFVAGFAMTNSFFPKLPCIGNSRPRLPGRY